MDRYKELYKNLLEPFQEQLWNHTLTSCPIIVGTDYNNTSFKLLYAGRAVNGWEYDWHEDSLEGLVEQVFNHGFDIKDIADKPVQPCGYNFNGSPFWQLCHQIMDDKGESESWSNKVAWSNLFKVAPFTGRNPNNKQIKIQIKACIDLLKMEIEIYKPALVVLVTDIWWVDPDITEYSFAKELGITLIPDSKSSIVGTGVYHGSKIVVTKRPETAKLSRAEHSEQILSTFLNL